MGAPVWAMTLTYDLIDQLTNKTETIGGQTNTFGYVYDLAGRLQQVWLNGTLSVTYTYDTNGNRLTRNAETAAYDARRPNHQLQRHDIRLVSQRQPDQRH